MRICTTCRDKKEDLEHEMLDIFESNNIQEISYELWETTERSKVVPHCQNYKDFVDMFLSKLEKYSSHKYEYQTQQKFYDNLKINLPPGKVLIAGDFAENLSLFEAQEIQSAYYGKEQVTIFPAVIHYNVDQKINQVSCVFISDTRHHRAQEVYAFMNVLNKEYLDIIAGERTQNIYMSDGAASHFKCRSNLVNLAHHSEDYGVSAEWHFQGTSHGKGNNGIMKDNYKRL